MIAFATHPKAPDIQPDDRPLVESLARLGFAVQGVSWDEPGIRWDQFEAIIPRSTWDYHLRFEEFDRWLTQVDGLPVWNPPPLLRWNSDKRYLLELEERGVRIPPTIHLPRGAKANLAEVLHERGWSQAVVKPTISAGAFQTWLATDSPGSQARLEAALEQGDMLVQRYMEEISTEGEWSLIFFHGQFSHAVLKTPRTEDFRVQEHLGGSTAAAAPPPPMLAQAQAALERAPGPTLYARVDGVRRAGEFLLMELELLEPSLYLSHAGAEGPRMFAEALSRLLGRG